MPTPTAWQQAADALYQAFLVNLIANAEAEAWAPDDEDSDSDSDDSSTAFTWDSSSSSSSADDDPTPAENYHHPIADLYSQRYLAECHNIPKTCRLLDLILTDYKHDFPNIFWSNLRIDPDCFDPVVEAIRDDRVFYSDSNNLQMPVEEQLAIVLYQFGHFGNAASTMKVALQFGLGSALSILSPPVMKATCTERFRAASVQWASPAAKETAKEWVGNTTCPAWRNSWLMVDGTLVLLFR
ncbi:hypothetical protein DFH08DRAFT_958473 [Mycena albidolilacea]|uniref:Uncharacterized protein n=1 Tax=Mycena albidolilacea TaxID=1033008 RepID=A0AAD7A7T9_9AGAR|nr:hypothetical protein DFH08DRAFT_958473 [Mycena albidolilacea]